MDPAVPPAQVIYKTDEPAPPASPSAPEEQGMGGAPANDDDVAVTGESKVVPVSVTIPRLMKEARKARKTYTKVKAAAEKAHSTYQTACVMRYELTGALMEATMIEREAAEDYKKLSEEEDKAGDALSEKEDELDEALNWNNAMGGPAHKRRRS